MVMPGGWARGAPDLFFAVVQVDAGVVPQVDGQAVEEWPVIVERWVKKGPGTVKPKKRLLRIL